jgi:RND family efflux transporter MFP subunit
MRAIATRRFQSMKMVKWAAVILSWAIVLSHLGCGTDEPTGKSEASLSKELALQPKIVSVTEVSLRDFDRSVQFTGTLQAENHAGLRALVEGTIDKIPVEIGDRVEKGQLLFQLRLVDYELRVRQAQSAIGVAEATKRTYQVSIEDAKREMLRMENLYKEGSATEQMQDRARTEYDRALALLEQAKATVVQARVGLDTALQALKDCTVAAPYTGFITGKFNEQGEYVRRGEVVVEIMDLATLEAEVALAERYFESVSPGTPVQIQVGSMDMQVEGKVIAVNPKIDPKTRTFLIKVRVDNREGRLKAGLFCSGLLSLTSVKVGIAVPSAAVLNDEGRSYVWVAKSGKVERRILQVGVTEGGFVQVIEGLETGEKVVVEGTGGLMDGSLVEVAPSP